MDCSVCGQRRAQIGVLCEECRDELSSPLRVTPEQIQQRGAWPTKAALVDPWGRPHRLEQRTLIGRHIDGDGLAVLEPSISRNHAELSFDMTGRAWTLRDLGSANGTFHNDVPVTAAPVVVRGGDKIKFGQVGFYLLEDATRLPSIKVDPLFAETVKPTMKISLADLIPPVDDFKEEEHTNVGLPTLPFRLSEPTGGGGGVIEVEGKQVQFTTTQFEFMAVMIKRMAEEAHQPDLVRGFVRSSELIADLSWDTREPTDNHVKQLVRRVRRALIKSEIGDLIESRHRFGYRLRVIPRIDS
jgi:hypothetical protein